MSDGENGGEMRRKAREPVFSLPFVVLALSVPMLLVQALSAFVLNPMQRVDLIVWLGFVPARLVAPDEFPGGLVPLVWTPLTYGFVHGGWEHVIGNVLWLVIFGTPVARRYGWLPSLVIFFVSSVVGAIAFGITEYNAVGYLVGASGGIAGFTGAAMRFIFQPATPSDLTDPSGRPRLVRRMAAIPELMRTPAARNFTILWAVFNCLVPLAPMFVGQDVGIAWQAHLGGFFTGLLLVPFFDTGASRVEQAA